jgi:membrane-bound lytic murein transglycosylase D
VQPDSPVTSDTVAIDYSIDLRLAADLVDVPTQQLLELNPGLLRLSTPPASALAEPFQLHLPTGTAALFQQRIANFPEDKRDQWRYHRVKPDDSLTSVAQGYHVSVEQLATVNQLQRNDDLSGIEALIVPVPLPAAPIKHSEIYRARRGDTLITIADRFSVSLEDLHRWNHLAGNSVAAGQRIRVEEPLRLASQPRNRSSKSQSESLASSSSRPEASAKISRNSRNSASASSGTATQTPSKNKGYSRYARRGSHSASHHAASAATHAQDASQSPQSARAKTEHKNAPANKKSTAKKKIQK